MILFLEKNTITPSVTYSQFFQIFTDDKQTRSSKLIPASSAAASVPIIQAAGVIVSPA